MSHRLTNYKFRNFLRLSGACAGARNWVDDFADTFAPDALAAAVWENCQRPEWMLWWLDELVEQHYLERVNPDSWQPAAEAIARRAIAQMPPIVRQPLEAALVNAPLRSRPMRERLQEVIALSHDLSAHVPYSALQLLDHLRTVINPGCYCWDVIEQALQCAARLDVPVGADDTRDFALVIERLNHYRKEVADNVRNFHDYAEIEAATLRYVAYFASNETPEEEY